MAAIFEFKRAWLVLLAVPAWLLPWLAAKHPAATERIYSTGIYPRLAGIFGRLSGLLPFSIAEIALVSFVLWLIWYIIYTLVKRDFAGLLATLLCLCGVIWFGFVALCGLNYHRETFAHNSGLEVRPSSAEELGELCEYLALQTSEYAALAARGEDGVTVSGFESWFEAGKFAPSAFETLGEKYPRLSGYCTRAKPVTASVGLSMADLVGVYFPFTFEGNVNKDAPAYVVPSAMLHELVHFKGYMREDEANFITYMACIASGNDEFAYSGAMLALRHSLNALYAADRDAYSSVYQTLHPGVLADYAANDAHWEKYEGPVATVSARVNDVYLKSNRQSAGVKSYGQMVDLLLAEYRQRQNN